MSKFNELHEHLKECVDSDNDSFIGITEDGVEFNMYEWAFSLSVQAKNENDKLVDFVKLVAKSDTRTHAHKHLAKELLKELGHEI